jgi:hypothetical protein
MQSFFTSRGKSLLILVGFGYLNLQFKFHLLLYSIDLINLITSIAAVRKEIQDETDRETGRSKAISSVPIHLSIYSPNGKDNPKSLSSCMCFLFIL